MPAKAVSNEPFNLFNVSKSVVVKTECEIVERK